MVDTAYHLRAVLRSILKVHIEPPIMIPDWARVSVLIGQYQNVYCESPGSQTWRCRSSCNRRAAHKKAVGFSTILVGGHYFNAFAHGCDVSIRQPPNIWGPLGYHAGSTVQQETGPSFSSLRNNGQLRGPMTLLGVRGLRTLDVRLERQCAMLQSGGMAAGRKKLKRSYPPQQ